LAQCLIVLINILAFNKITRSSAVIIQTALHLVLQSIHRILKKGLNILGNNARDVHRRSQAFGSAALNMWLMPSFSPCNLPFFKMAGCFKHNCKAGFGNSILSNAFVHIGIDFGAQNHYVQGQRVKLSPFLV
jgi:hypothetical protein